MPPTTMSVARASPLAATSSNGQAEDRKQLAVAPQRAQVQIETQRANEQGKANFRVPTQ